MATDSDLTKHRRDDLLEVIRQRELEPDEPVGSGGAVEQPTDGLTDERSDREIMLEWDRHYLPGKANGTPFLGIVVNFARAIERAAIAAHLASQSQAAQPSGDDQWIFDLAAEHEANQDGLYGPVVFDSTGLVDFARAIAAHLAGKSQATKAQAELIADLSEFTERSIREHADFRDDVERLSTADSRTRKALRKEIYDTIDARVRNAVKAALAAPVAKEVQAVPEGFALVPEAANADEIVSRLYRRFKEWAARGFGPSAVADALAGLYYCGRVWSAWGVGTMSEDDFSPADEDNDIIENVADAALNAMVLASVTQQAAKAETAEQAVRTDEQIVQQTEELAAELALMDGYRLNDGTFRDSLSSRARKYWERACAAQRILTNTDPDDAASGTESSDLAPTTSTVSAPDALRDVRAEVRDLQNNLETFGPYGEETARVAIDGVLDLIDDHIAALRTSTDQADTDTGSEA
jgi:hypothetical protein